MARPGDPILLNALLWDRNDNKTVVATLKADGIPLPYSPITLQNIGNGEYYFRDPANVVFPENTYKVIIRYDVYDDAQLTKLSNRHAPMTAEEALISVATDPVIVAKLDTLTSLVIAHDSNSELQGYILEISHLVGEILGSDVIGYLKQPTNELLGYVEDIETLGILDNNNTNTNGVV